MELTTKWLKDLIQAKKENRSVEFCRETLRSRGYSLTPEECEEYKHGVRYRENSVSRV